jgi:hypothetical protein
MHDQTPGSPDRQQTAEPAGTGRHVLTRTNPGLDAPILRFHSNELRARWADTGHHHFSLSSSTGEMAGVRCRIPQCTANPVAVRKCLPDVL